MSPRMTNRVSSYGSPSWSMLIYQHRTTERDRLIADAMDTIMQAELGGTDDAGTQRARDAGTDAENDQDES